MSAVVFPHFSLCCEFSFFFLDRTFELLEVKNAENWKFSIVFFFSSHSFTGHSFIFHVNNR